MNERASRIRSLSILLALSAIAIIAATIINA